MLCEVIALPYPTYWAVTTLNLFYFILMEALKNHPEVINVTSNALGRCLRTAATTFRCTV